jgi:hypothetical protein
VRRHQSFALAPVSLYLSLVPYHAANNICLALLNGVRIGHRQLTHNCALIRCQFGITPSDCEVSWLPQYHDMGLVGKVSPVPPCPLHH